MLMLKQLNNEVSEEVENDTNEEHPDIEDVLDKIVKDIESDGKQEPDTDPEEGQSDDSDNSSDQSEIEQHQKTREELEQELDNLKKVHGRQSNELGMLRKSKTNPKNSNDSNDINQIENELIDLYKELEESIDPSDRARINAKISVKSQRITALETYNLNKKHNIDEHNNQKISKFSDKLKNDGFNISDEHMEDLVEYARQVSEVLPNSDGKIDDDILEFALMKKLGRKALDLHKQVNTEQKVRNDIQTAAKKSIPRIDTSNSGKDNVFEKIKNMGSEERNKVFEELSTEELARYINRSGSVR